MTLKHDFDNFVSNWQSFFFQPISPVAMGVFRILVGIVLLQFLLIHLLADWSLYYGNHAIIPIEDSIGKYWRHEPYFDAMLLLPPGETWRWYFFLGTCLFGFMMTIGLFTRVSTVLVFVGLTSLHSHFLLNLNSGDNYLRLCCFFLAFSNAGDALSVDRLLKAVQEDWRISGLRAPLSAPWAQRMIQLQIAIAYGHTWFCKIAGDEWNNGMAVYYASRYDDITRFQIPYLLDNLWTIKILTWGTLLIELLLFTLIWWRPARYWVLLAGLALHIGIEWTMNLPMFEWLFMFTYILFIYPEDLERFWHKVQNFVRENIFKPASLYFDGDCIVCVRAVGLIHHLDIFAVVKLVDFRRVEALEGAGFADRLEKEILLKTASGSIEGGFKAFRWMTGRLPLLMILWPILHVPLVSNIGEAVYNLVAANRYTILSGSCEHEQCAPVASGSQDK